MPRRTGEYVQRKINLPVELDRKINMMFYDPLTGKPRYGAVSQWLTSLAIQYFEQIENQKPNPLYIEEKKDGGK